MRWAAAKLRSIRGSSQPMSAGGAWSWRSAKSLTRSAASSASSGGCRRAAPAALDPAGEVGQAHAPERRCAAAGHQQRAAARAEQVVQVQERALGGLARARHVPRRRRGRDRPALAGRPRSAGPRPPPARRPPRPRHGRDGSCPSPRDRSAPACRRASRASRRAPPGRAALASETKNSARPRAARAGRSSASWRAAPAVGASIAGGPALTTPSGMGRAEAGRRRAPGRGGRRAGAPRSRGRAWRRGSARCRSAR